MAPSSKRRPRILRNLVVEEVSAVDRGAGEGCAVLLRKRDNDEPYNKFAKIFGAKPRRTVGGYDPAIIRKYGRTDPRRNSVDDDSRHFSGDGVDGTDDDNNTCSTPQSGFARHLHEMADLIVEASGGQVTRPMALHWLLNDKRGRTIATSLHKQHDEQRKEQPTMTIMERITKAGLDPISVCKTIATERRAYSITEHELTELIQKYASANRLPGESAASAFARVFSADNDEGLAFRKAIQIAKGASLEPLMVGGAAAQAGSYCCLWQR